MSTREILLIERQRLEALKTLGDLTATERKRLEALERAEEAQDAPSTHDTKVRVLGAVERGFHAGQARRSDR